MLKIRMNYFIKSIIIFVVCLFVALTLDAQKMHTLDSLTRLYKLTVQDSSKVKILIGIAYEYRYTRPDTSLTILSKAKQMAVNAKSEKQMAECLAEMGYVWWVQTKFDTAMRCAQKAMDVSIPKGYKKTTARSYQLMGMCMRDLGNHPLALDYFFKSLKINESLKNKKEIANCNNNIGEIYEIQENHTLALEYYNRSYKIRQEIGDKHGLARIYLNMAELYIATKVYSKAIECSLQSMKISQEIGNKLQIANNLSALSTCFHQEQNFSKAIESASGSLSLNLELKNNKNIAKNYSQLASSYLAIGNIEMAEDAAKQSLAIAQNQHLLSVIRTSSNLLYEIYKGKNKTTECLAYLEISISAKDSMFSLEKEKKIDQIKFAFDLQKKEKELELAEKATKVQRRITIAVGFAFLILCLMSVFIFLSRKKLQSLYNLVSNQHVEITQKNEELQLLNEEMTTQRDNMELFAENLQVKNQEITEQKNEIETKNNKIRQSIEYAKRIQTALLPTDQFISKGFPDHFVLYKPKDIVSGDFYWCGQAGNQYVLLSADCTGHGVPGAFMSMLGITLLHEIVRRKDIQSAAMVLNSLRDEVKNALQQTGRRGEQRDGMDVALCVLDTESLKMQFAGANCPLYLLRKDKVIALNTDANMGFEVIDADKMPIGVHPNDHIGFTNHELQMEHGDQIYIFTDGYHSQFGGERGEKLKTKPFQKIILEYATLPFSEQAINLQTEFDLWRGEHEQVDDVLVLGVKI